MLWTALLVNPEALLFVRLLYCLSSADALLPWVLRLAAILFLGAWRWHDV